MVQPVRRVEGKSLSLVPYEREHVPRYHAWLQDPELIEATASEPLSLAEHYELQQSWSSDTSKCMFIILDKDRLDGGYQPDSPCIDAMVGDVNIFMNDSNDQHAAELLVMIAEPLSRGKGLAKEAVQLMMKYASQNLGISKFRVKIDDFNSASLRLFQKLGFQNVAYSEVFKEVTLELLIDVNQKELEISPCYVVQETI
ncbi:unnamed protein product [Calypogeia fissa]